jgi:hypothetical protein
VSTDPDSLFAGGVVGERLFVRAVDAYVGEAVWAVAHSRVKRYVTAREIARSACKCAQCAATAGK